MRGSVAGGLLVAAMVSGCAEAEAQPACGPARARVLRVVDGDSIVLETGDRVRYLLVDTPELRTSECFAREAHALHASWVAGAEVELDYDVRCRDRYDRLLAYVFVDGRSVNRMLLERGAGRLLFIAPNGADAFEDYARAQAHAQRVRAGLWGACETR